jgi:PIN domain nuclease of toxin-antitoxin system
VRLLLDTHVSLWRRLAPERLSDGAERAVADRDSTLHISPISTWETFAFARRQGRPSLRPFPSERVLDALRRAALTTVPLSHGIALRSEALEGFESADPADRFLVATTLEHELVLVTADAAMRSFKPVETLW